jgi:hypothetical protein
MLDEREKLEYPNLHSFFTKPDNIKKIIPIINRERKKTNVSLSLLDWFVTSYSKNTAVVYNLTPKKTFNVFSEYKAQLTDYKKEYFDPFNRGKKIFSLEYEKDKSIKTTFKQLNFLRWVVKNKILKYIEDNYDKIRDKYEQFKKNKTVGKKEIVAKPVFTYKMTIKKPS